MVARCGNGVLLVARANQTSQDPLNDACQRCADDGTVVLGTVLNRWDPKQSNRYGYYRITTSTATAGAKRIHNSRQRR